MWTIKKNQVSATCAFDELDGGGVFSPKKKVLQGCKTENFTGAKTGNNLY